jgi:hypothetical protein
VRRKNFLSTTTTTRTRATHPHPHTPPTHTHTSPTRKGFFESFFFLVSFFCRRSIFVPKTGRHHSFVFCCTSGSQRVC